MSHAFSDTITLLEAERAACVARATEIEAIIERLQTLGGAPATRRAPKPARRPEAPAPKVARKKPTTRQVDRPAVEPGSPAERAQRRDDAILARLARGPLPYADLLSALPAEPGRTDEQRRRDCSNALFRLKTRGQIRQSDEDGTYARA